jgi:hypothetical protein
LQCSQLRHTSRSLPCSPPLLLLLLLPLSLPLSLLLALSAKRMQPGS